MRCVTSVVNFRPPRRGILKHMHTLGPKMASPPRHGGRERGSNRLDPALPAPGGTSDRLSSRRVGQGRLDPSALGFGQPQARRKCSSPAMWGLIRHLHSLDFRRARSPLFSWSPSQASFFDSRLSRGPASRRSGLRTSTGAWTGPIVRWWLRRAQRSHLAIPRRRLNSTVACV
jgi:hypothetical protein